MQPIVRYMLLCQDWGFSDEGEQAFDIQTILCSITSSEFPPFPLSHEELCVLMVLTETRGTGEFQIIVVLEETGQRLFGTPRYTHTFGNDPLAIVGLPFRIRDCLFPQPGIYSVQFWYNDVMVQEQPLRLR